MGVETSLETLVMSSMRWLAIGVLVLTGSAATAGTTAVVVGGIGGNPEFEERFETSAASIADGLKSVASNPGDVRLIARGATKESILAAIEEATKSPSDLFVLALVGHGNVDSRGWHFNVEGPDLNTEELIAALAAVNSTNQLIIVATSSSGKLLETLAQPGRVLITATKGGGEINAVRFPVWLAEAMNTSKADLDRNEILTAAEAYRYANQKTIEYYDTKNLLATEHARLRGESADTLALARLGALKEASEDPEVARLLAVRLGLETEFRTLRARKSMMNPEQYYDELEQLLVSIATLQQSIDKATGWSESDADS